MLNICSNWIKRIIYICIVTFHLYQHARSTIYIFSRLSISCTKTFSWVYPSL